MMTLCLVVCLGATVAQAPAMQTVRADDVVRAVVTELQTRSQSDDRQTKLALLGHLQDQSIPAGDVRIEVGEIAGPWPRPKVGVPVAVLVNNRKVRAMTVWLSVKMPKRAWVYGDAYTAGQAADSFRVLQSDADLACCAGTPVSSPDELRGTRLRKPVREGQPLMADDFELVPDVQSRTAVDVEVVRGQVRLAVTGRALRDGNIGEFVDVLVNGAQTAVRARIIAKQKVGIYE